jgi:UDP-glucose 4-epimerase
MSERVLVTGSQGFVGAHVRRLLERRGLTPIGVDVPGSTAEFQVDLADPKFDAAGLAEQIGPVRTILHLAARITRGSSVDVDARRNLRAIAEVPVSLMEAWSRLYGSTHLVFCSSIKVYGAAVPSPVSPDASPLHPDPYSYGSAKALAERLLEVSRLRGQGSYSIVRPAYIYGPGQRATTAIPAFLTAALQGKPPLVFGDGRQIRDDVLVTDVAYCLLEAGLRKLPGAVNVGGERARTLWEVAELCCQAVERMGGPAGLAPRLEARSAARWVEQSYDISRTRDVLEYEPVPLLEGLAREARWIAAGAESARALEFAEDGGGLG